MYGKHFTSTYTGSMYGAGVGVFAVWGYVIASTKGGQVELNPIALASVLGCAVPEIESAIEYLCSPDPKSRNKEHEGRRLLKVGEYAYDVPSFEHYRSMRDENDRREYMREYMREYRAKPKADKVLRGRKQPSKSSKPPLAYTEAEAEAEAETNKKTTPLASATSVVDDDKTTRVKTTHLPIVDTVETPIPPQSNLDPLAKIAELIRSNFYVPDGEPPDRWGIERCLSIVKRLAAIHSWVDIEQAIQGAAIMRDNPGKYQDGGKVWVGPGEKMTMGALYSQNGKVGARPLFGVAIDVYHKAQERGPQRVGDLLRRAAERGS